MRLDPSQVLKNAKRQSPCVLIGFPRRTNPPIETVESAHQRKSVLSYFLSFDSVHLSARVAIAR